MPRGPHQPNTPVVTKNPYIKFKNDYPCATFELRTRILEFKQALDQTTLNEVESCIDDVIKGFYSAISAAELD
ncbi:3018_t:CDS:2, partial [Racocetra fulgida]